MKKNIYEAVIEMVKIELAKERPDECAVKTLIKLYLEVEVPIKYINALIQEIAEAGWADAWTNEEDKVDYYQELCKDLSRQFRIVIKTSLMTGLGAKDEEEFREILNANFALLEWIDKDLETYLL